MLTFNELTKPNTFKMNNKIFQYNAILTCKLQKKRNMREGVPCSRYIQKNDTKHAHDGTNTKGSYIFKLINCFYSHEYQMHSRKKKT